MADFKQACEWMKEGKKVRQPGWIGTDTHIRAVSLKAHDGVTFVEYFYNGAVRDGLFDLESFSANDWEIYE